MMEHVADVTDLEPGEAMRLELDGPDGALVALALVRAEDGTFHAVSDVCSHGQVSLSEGEVEGSTIECWLHGSAFDLASGRPTALPATQPVPVYALAIEGEKVLVDIDSTA